MTNNGKMTGFNYCHIWRFIVQDGRGFLFRKLTTMNQKSNPNRINEVYRIMRQEGFGMLAEFVKHQTIEGASFWRRLIFNISLGLFIRKTSQESLPKRLRVLLEHLGPTFVKFGQMLAIRTDLIPKEFCEELEKLQSQVTPFAAKDAFAIIESELECSIHEVFDSIDEEPLAAASMAQVHAAKLKDGTDVVIKIKRPGTDRIVRGDIRIINWLAKQLERLSPFARKMGLCAMTEAFSVSHMRQLDFVSEARSARKFRENYQDHPDVYVPEVYPRYCTRNVIVMERIFGRSLEPIETLEKDGISPKALANKLLRCVFEQFALYGLYHADIHAGNFFILKDGRIGLVDFGLIDELPRTLQYQMLRFWYHESNGNHEDAAETAIEMSHFSSDADLEGFRKAYIEFLEEGYHDEVPIFEFVQDQAALGLKYRVRMPHQLVMSGRALGLVIGICSKLVATDYRKMMETAEPLIRDLVKRRLEPKKIFEEFKNLTPEFIEFVELYPTILKRFFAIERGFATSSWWREVTRSDFHPPFLKRETPAGGQWMRWIFLSIVWVVVGMVTLGSVFILQHHVETRLLIISILGSFTILGLGTTFLVLKKGAI